MEKNLLFDAAVNTGQQGVFAIYTSDCLYTQAIYLRDIRKTRAYRRLKLTWEEYCFKYCGLTSHAAKKQIDRLNEFGEPFFRLGGIVRISDAFFRQIRDRVTAHSIELDGQKIPLTSINGDKIRAGIRRLRAILEQPRNARRTPTPALVFRVRADALLKAVFARARLGSALPVDEVSALRTLVFDTADQWARLADLLRPTDPVDAAA